MTGTVTSQRHHFREATLRAKLIALLAGTILLFVALALD
jgi:hypothetical protein